MYEMKIAAGARSEHAAATEHGSKFKRYFIRKEADHEA